MVLFIFWDFYRKINKFFEIFFFGFYWERKGDRFGDQLTVLGFTEINRPKIITYLTEY